MIDVIVNPEMKETNGDELVTKTVKDRVDKTTNKWGSKGFIKIVNVDIGESVLGAVNMTIPNRGSNRIHLNVKDGK